MAKTGRIIKLSKNLRPFVSRAVRDGRAQRDFAFSIGEPVGKCVKAGVKKGMTGVEVHKVVSDCAKAYKGKKIKGTAPKR